MDSSLSESFQNNNFNSTSTFSRDFSSALPAANSPFITTSLLSPASSSNAHPIIQNESLSFVNSLWPLAPSPVTTVSQPPIGPELRFEWRLGGPNIFVRPVGLVVFRPKPAGSERFTDPLLLIADMHRNTLVVLNLAGKDSLFITRYLVLHSFSRI